MNIGLSDHERELLEEKAVWKIVSQMITDFLNEGKKIPSAAAIKGLCYLQEGMAISDESIKACLSNFHNYLPS